MENIQYGFLMKRVLFTTDIYIFKPIQLCEGILETIDETPMFIDKIGNSYLLSNNVEGLSCDEELSVFHIISKEDLEKEYSGYSLEEALELYYMNTSSILTIGFLNEETDELHMFFQNLDEMISKISLFTQDTKEQEEIKQSQEELSMIITTGKDLLNFYEKSNQFLIENDNIEETKSIIKQIIDFYNNLFHDFDLREQNETNKLCKEYIADIIDSYEQICNYMLLDIIIQKIIELKENMYSKIKTISEAFELDPYKIESSKMDQINEIEYYKKVKEMKDFIDKKVIGQEQAKRAIISSIVMNSLSEDKSDRNSCLLIGPTGSGKTLLTETISEYLGVPMTIYDTTQLTTAGYIGGNLEDCLTSLLAITKGNLKEAEKGIVVFDEIDKKGSANNSDSSGRGALNNLLPFMQGTTYQVKCNNKTVLFDTSKLTVLATGSFAEAVRDRGESEKSIGFSGHLIENSEDIKYPKLTIEDLAMYGNVPKELLGRFTTIVQLHGHTKESLRKIILDSESSALLHEKKKLSKIKIELDWTEEFIDKVVTRALELKTGARSIKSSLEEAVLSARWHVLVNYGKYNKIVLTKDTVNDNNDCLIYDIEGSCYNLKDLIEKNNEKVKVLEYKG